MTAVVDTNVVAYHLLSTQPFDAEARAFLASAGRLWAPSSFVVELLNVLWMATRSGQIDAATAEALLNESRHVIDSLVSVDEVAIASLSLAVHHDHPVYDTVFVALAVREGIPLATFDKQVLQRFPDIARRPGDLLASAPGAA